MRLTAPARLIGAFVLATLAAGCNKKDKDAEEETETDSDIDDPVDEFADDDIGAWLSLEATADGKVAAAAYDRTQDGLVYGTAAISGADVTWTWEVVDSFPDENGLNPGDAGKYASMAMAADGTPWIAYQDTTNHSLRYAFKSGGVWTTGLADTGGGMHPDGGYWATLAISPSSGAPVVAHHDADTGTLRVSRWDGATFQHDTPIEGTASVAEDGTEIAAKVGEYAKLAIGPAGTEYVAYYDRAWGDLKVAMNTGSGWTVETVDSDGDVGQWPDIVISGGVIYVSYHDVTNQNLKLAYGAPGAWTIETVDAGDYVGADSAVLIKDGNPEIVYFDAVKNDVKLARKSGSWATSTAASDGALGYHNEIVEVGGTVYAGCYSYSARHVWLGAL